MSRAFFLECILGGCRTCLCPNAERFDESGSLDAIFRTTLIRAVLSTLVLVPHTSAVIVARSAQLDCSYSVHSFKRLCPRCLRVYSVPWRPSLSHEMIACSSLCTDKPRPGGSW
jgi:hypothetical protein